MTNRAIQALFTNRTAPSIAGDTHVTDTNPLKMEQGLSNNKVPEHLWRLIQRTMNLTAVRAACLRYSRMLDNGQWDSNLCSLFFSRSIISLFLLFLPVSLFPYIWCYFQCYCEFPWLRRNVCTHSEGTTKNCNDWWDLGIKSSPASKSILLRWVKRFGKDSSIQICRGHRGLAWNTYQMEYKRYICTLPPPVTPSRKVW